MRARSSALGCGVAGERESAFHLSLLQRLWPNEFAGQELWVFRNPLQRRASSAVSKLLFLKAGRSKVIRPSDKA